MNKHKNKKLSFKKGKHEKHINAPNQVKENKPADACGCDGGCGCGDSCSYTEVVTNIKLEQLKEGEHYVVSVRFKRAGKVYFFQPAENETYIAGDKVIVQTARGIEMGEVAKGIIKTKDIVPPLQPVLRKATQSDIEHENKLQAKKADALQKAEQLISNHDLIMKLVDVDFTFDDTKVIFYFVAEGRVDFRELVKDLASHFKLRIELRQIGVRDHAKLIGGLASCGRACCCSSHSSDFGNVTVKMAKVQGITLNPTKISGLCGRLMCCLKHENEHYSKTYSKMPRLDKPVTTPDGKGIAIKNNVLIETVTVKFTNEDGLFEIKDYKLSLLKNFEPIGESDELLITDDVKSILD